MQLSEKEQHMICEILFYCMFVTEDEAYTFDRFSLRQVLYRSDKVTKTSPSVDTTVNFHPASVFVFHLTVALFI